jgi:vacuolar protein sorting-associated protein 35
LFVQETIAVIGQSHAETAIKLCLEAALVANRFVVADASSANEASSDFRIIAHELLVQALGRFEHDLVEVSSQYRSLESIIGTLLEAKSLRKAEYESMCTKVAQFSAKIVRKADQCRLVMNCAHLFYPVATTRDISIYGNPQRALECLQRALKLADAATAANPAHVRLFIDLLEIYIFFFEHKNPVIKDTYVTGLLALVMEQVNILSGSLSNTPHVEAAKNHYSEVLQSLQRKKTQTGLLELFGSIQVESFKF